jgi:hypothetical protein
VSAPAAGVARVGPVYTPPDGDDADTARPSPRPPPEAAYDPARPRSCSTPTWPTRPPTASTGLSTSAHTMTARNAPSIPAQYPKGLLQVRLTPELRAPAAPAGRTARAEAVPGVVPSRHRRSPGDAGPRTSGHEKHQAAADSDGGNIRNGTRSKTVLTEATGRRRQLQSGRSLSRHRIAPWNTPGRSSPFVWLEIGFWQHAAKSTYSPLPLSEVDAFWTQSDAIQTFSR